MLIQEAVSEFLVEHKARGSRPATVRWYSRTLTMLLQPCLHEDVSALTLFTVNKALDKDVKPGTLANYDRALRCFCKWLWQSELITKNPFANRKRPRVRWEPKDTLTEEEVKRMFAIASSDKRYSYRNRAILFLFFDTGMRAAEVARVKLTDISFDYGEVKVDGKTGNAVLPISKNTVKAIRQYVSHKRKGRSDYLFLHAGKPVTATSLSQLVKRIGKRAGITRPIGSHLLRHTVATEWLRRGGDTFSLMRLLRHSSTEMTNRYANLVTNDLRSKTSQHGLLNAMRDL